MHCEYKYDRFRHVFQNNNNNKYIYKINKQIKTFSRYLREAIHFQNN